MTVVQNTMKETVLDLENHTESVLYTKHCLRHHNGPLKEESRYIIAHKFNQTWNNGKRPHRDESSRQALARCGINICAKRKRNSVFPFRAIVLV